MLLPHDFPDWLTSVFEDQFNVAREELLSAKTPEALWAAQARSRVLDSIQSEIEFRAAKEEVDARELQERLMPHA